MVEPIHIFISYSHLDIRWFDPKYQYNLIPWIEEALHRDNVLMWYDRNEQDGLHGGQSFREEIELAIDQSQIAILLISEAFLSSDFIQDIELPRILNKVEHHETRLIPILVEPCDWKRFDYLVSRQLLPGEPTPLIEYTDTDSKWAHVRSQILKEIRITLNTVRKGQEVSTYNSSSPPSLPPTLKTSRIGRFSKKKFVWIGILSLVIILVGAFLLFNNHSLANAIPALYTPTEAIAPRPTLIVNSNTPTPNLSAFQWPIVQRDLFNQNNHDWPILGDTGVNPDITQLEILNGQYTWSVQANSLYDYAIINNSISSTKCAVSVDANLIDSTSTSTHYGLILRYQDPQNWYFFGLDSDHFSFLLFSNGNWITLIPWTQIPVGQTNHLAVIADGDLFSFYINDQYIGAITNNMIPSGKVGLDIGFNEINVHGQISFDNFEYRAP